jgi:S-adenosylmethionine synthetase
MRNIIVEDLKQTPLEKQRIEIVERKGKGHPDYICDAVMDQISVALSQEYLAKAGTILHHNLDKALLVAGETELKFGGGTLKQPLLFIFGDRATSQYDNMHIDIDQIATSTAKQWFKTNIKNIDPEKHIKYQNELKPGSAGLTDIFKRKGHLLGANDTSAAVGYAPMTRTEKTVFNTENYLNSLQFKQRHPETGEDIKIMAFRDRNRLQLTVAMAFIDKYVNSEQDYFDKKTIIQQEIREFVTTNTDFDDTTIELNTLDEKNRGINGCYVTVLGTSADNGDSGQVGRGNRVNGLISLNRPFCSEAAAGKNPVSHVGKIYNFLTFKMAQNICTEIPEIQEVYIWLLSKIGSPIDNPAVAAAQVIMKDANNLNAIKQKISETLDNQLENIDKFTQELAQGKMPPC